jgi:Starch/carbohydrate-binding module (family 53)
VCLRQVEKHKLSVAGEWWGATADIPGTAAVVDFVMSNGALNAWDNNSSNDFHTPVQDAPSGERLQQMLFDALMVRVRLGLSFC